MTRDTSFLNYGPGDHPKPEGAHAFVQWKATDVFMDFHCDCGAQGTFDGYFAYVVKCGNCGQDWEMPAHLFPRKVGPQSFGHDPKPLEMDDDG